MLGSFAGSTLLERIGPARTYAGGLVLMALGFGGAAASPNIWVAAMCAAVGGVGDGAAIVCNAVLVQRGAADEMRGRALTLVMSATFLATAAANGIAGALLNTVSPRWIWGGAAIAYIVAAGVDSLRRPRARARRRCCRTRAPGAAPAAQGVGILDSKRTRSRPASARATGARARAPDHPGRERGPRFACWRRLPTSTPSTGNA